MKKSINLFLINTVINKTVNFFPSPKRKKMIDTLAFFVLVYNQMFENICLSYFDEFN